MLRALPALRDIRPQRVQLAEQRSWTRDVAAKVVPFGEILERHDVHGDHRPGQTQVAHHIDWQVIPHRPIHLELAFMEHRCKGAVDKINPQAGLLERPIDPNMGKAACPRAQHSLSGAADNGLCAAFTQMLDGASTELGLDP
jgi:hypothetical protein